ncbi:hypothetical protein ABW19_dt0208844 [Dactylella cylindrospora]|nr:hypothetical protein ABW19_dt0208844 [Dactylella cylindrospora]
MLTHRHHLLSKLSKPSSLCFNLVTSSNGYRKPASFGEIKMATSSSSNNTKIDTSDPVFFWKPEDEDGYLGQWYPSNFVSTSEDGKQVEYRNCEHLGCMQSLEDPVSDILIVTIHKFALVGLLFAPNAPVTAEILDEHVSPKTIKALGRAVPNFDDDVWKENRYKIVVEANYLKFTQNDDLKTKLLGTGNRELVEASPRDRIWGVGYGAERCRNTKNRSQWGLNLLGKALMDVRERIREEEGK